MTSEAISVLMPARDAGATIERAARSTLRALRPSDELLVLDDGSEDDTAAVLARVNDRRLRVLESPEPVGVAAGLTRLLAESGHPLVARMDADDVALPGRFALQAAALRGHDLAFGNIVPFGPDSPRFPLTSLVRLPDRVLRLWWTLENPVAHSAMIGRRPVLLAAGGYCRSAAEDWDLWLRASAAGARARRTTIPVTAYRLHPGQVSNSAAYRDSLGTDTQLVASWRGHVSRLGGPTDDELSLTRRLEHRSPFVTWLSAESRRLPPVHARVLQRRITTLVAAQQSGRAQA